MYASVAGTPIVPLPSLPNPQRQQSLSTGRYTLQDVRCRACCASLGWKYVAVHDNAEQQYKLGTFLLQESALMLELSPSSQERGDGSSPISLGSPLSSEGTPHWGILT